MSVRPLHVRHASRKSPLEVEYALLSRLDMEQGEFGGWFELTSPACAAEAKFRTLDACHATRLQLDALLRSHLVACCESPSLQLRMTWSVSAHIGCEDVAEPRHAWRWHVDCKALTVSVSHGIVSWFR